MKRIIKIIYKIILLFIFFCVLVYGILWVFSFKTHSLVYGISFSPEYAQSLNLDWQKAYIAILDGLKPKYLRLSAPWSNIESRKGIYNFNTTDYLINEAGKRGIKVTLVLGQKVPRWPECYIPDWAKSSLGDEKKQALMEYVGETVKRYRNNVALEMWQVENEPFIKFDFGDCVFFDPSVVESEIYLVKSLDNNHKIIITDSGELSTWYKASKVGDILGTTLYRTVRTPGDMIVKYDWLPAAYYKFKAFLWNNEEQNFFISELQAEPWFGAEAPAISTISRMEETLSPERLQENISYAKHLGASRAYFWGAEWWYWMKTVKGDSRYWDIVKGIL
jgi:hypothetical protein